MLAAIKAELKLVANPEKALILRRFFKTGKGEYAEGDRFVGGTVPELRRIVGHYAECPMLDIQKLLSSKIHEERFIGLQLLVSRFQSGDEKMQKRVYEFYMRSLSSVNNWDLVDSSALQIVGAYLFDKERDVLFTLAKSQNMWKRRIAIIATFYFVRKGEFRDTLAIAELLLEDKQDLIHKAVGWMLREVGKRDKLAEVKFLNAHAYHMPRTMLRYAIERFPESERRAFLSRTQS